MHRTINLKYWSWLSTIGDVVLYEFIFLLEFLSRLSLGTTAYTFCQSAMCGQSWAHLSICSLRYPFWIWWETTLKRQEQTPVTLDTMGAICKDQQGRRVSHRPRGWLLWEKKHSCLFEGNFVPHLTCSQALLGEVQPKLLGISKLFRTTSTRIERRYSGCFLSI